MAQDPSVRSRLALRFADREVLAKDGRTRSSLRDLPSADFVIDAARLAASPVDYLSPLVALIDGKEIFTGGVTRADPTAGEVHVTCRGGLSLTETLAPNGFAQDCPHQELVYALARAAGYTEDRLRIQGLDQLPHERVEVVVPLIGIELTAPLHVADVEFLPAIFGASLTKPFAPREPLVDEFESGLAYARFATNASRLFDAEQLALEAIDAATSWLTVCASYGFAVLPSGELQRFSRANALARPRRLAIVAAVGTETGRRWMRRPPGDPIESRLVIDDHSLFSETQANTGFDETDRQSLLAASRAIGGNDRTQRVQALWESFEFYVGREGGAKLFTKADRKMILVELELTLSAPQLERLAEVVNGPLNDAPLMAKLFRTLAREGVPLSSGEEAVLKRLRSARNQATHGRGIEAVTDEDVQRGCAILCRALIVRVWERRLLRSGETRPENAG